MINFDNGLKEFSGHLKAAQEIQTRLSDFTFRYLRSKLYTLPEILEMEGLNWFKAGIDRSKSPSKLHSGLRYYKINPYKILVYMWSPLISEFSFESCLHIFFKKLLGRVDIYNIQVEEIEKILNNWDKISYILNDEEFLDSRRRLRNGYFTDLEKDLFKYNIIDWFALYEGRDSDLQFTKSITKREVMEKIYEPDFTSSMWYNPEFLQIHRDITGTELIEKLKINRLYPKLVEKYSDSIEILKERFLRYVNYNDVSSNLYYVNEYGQPICIGSKNSIERAKCVVQDKTVKFIYPSNTRHYSLKFATMSSSILNYIEIDMSNDEIIKYGYFF